MEHRIEPVRVLDGVTYYNDSIGTSPTRTIAGLRSFDQKVILIAGGYDKHIPYEPLAPEITAHVKNLVLMGATGPASRRPCAKTELQRGRAAHQARRQHATTPWSWPAPAQSPVTSSFSRRPVLLLTSTRTFEVRGASSRASSTR